MVHDNVAESFSPSFPSFVFSSPSHFFSKPTNRKNQKNPKKKKNSSLSLFSVSLSVGESAGIARRRE
ncbi:predicted protein [Arabidopsis lyrata subsp. lyrata]|uniref:Predicted protein n=1 Tax=Arabidopsis lyrata subsp. lyrata TaxID=81972 RepID=D7MKP5_ARALL|nr:predicted protein [Arabidopsis lyrata subsp. lyrata]